MQAKKVGKVGAKVIHATLDTHLSNGMTMDHQGLPPVDVPMACIGDVAGDRACWPRSAPAARKTRGSGEKPRPRTPAATPSR